MVRGNASAQHNPFLTELFRQPTFFAHKYNSDMEGAATCSASPQSGNMCGKSSVGALSTLSFHPPKRKQEWEVPEAYMNMCTPLRCLHSFRGLTTYLKNSALGFCRSHKPVLVSSFIHVDEPSQMLSLAELTVKSIMHNFIPAPEHIFVDDFHGVHFSSVFFPHLHDSQAELEQKYKRSGT